MKGGRHTIVHISIMHGMMRLTTINFMEYGMEYGTDFTHRRTLYNPVASRVSSTGGNLPPQTLNLPPQKQFMKQVFFLLPVCAHNF